MPLHHVDPHKKRGRLYKVFVRIGRSRPGQAWARHRSSHRPAVVPCTGGRDPSVLGAVATALLMTTGAKSGQPGRYSSPTPRWARRDLASHELRGSEAPAVVLQPDRPLRVPVRRREVRGLPDPVNWSAGPRTGVRP